MFRPASLVLLLALLLVAGGAAAQAPPAASPLPCSDYREVKRQLGSRYDEAPVSLGLQSNGHLLQVFASPRSGSWTIVSTSPRGVACILAAGRGWEPLPREDPGPAA